MCHLLIIFLLRILKSTRDMDLYHSCLFMYGQKIHHILQCSPACFRVILPKFHDGCFPAGSTGLSSTFYIVSVFPAQTLLSQTPLADSSKVSASKPWHLLCVLTFDILYRLIWIMAKTIAHVLVLVTTLYSCLVNCIRACMRTCACWAQSCD